MTETFTIKPLVWEKDDDWDLWHSNGVNGYRYEVRTGPPVSLVILKDDEERSRLKGGSREAAVEQANGHHAKRVEQYLEKVGDDD